MEKFPAQILNQCLTILESGSGSVLIMDHSRRGIVVREITSQYQGRIGLERGSQGGVQFTLEIPIGDSHESAYSDHR